MSLAFATITCYRCKIWQRHSVAAMKYVACGDNFVCLTAGMNFSVCSHSGAKHCFTFGHKEYQQQKCESFRLCQNWLLKTCQCVQVCCSCVDVIWATVQGRCYSVQVKFKELGSITEYNLNSIAILLWLQRNNFD